MTRVRSSSSSRAEAARLDNRRTKGERLEQLKLLEKKIGGLGRDERSKTVHLERETFYCVETPDGRYLPDFHLEGDDRDEVRGFNNFAVDRENGEFYFTGYDETCGPIELPQGFRYENLFPNTRRDPPARTQGHKVLKALTKAIHDQEPEVFGRPWVNMDYDSSGRTWRTESGGKLHKATPYDKRYEYGTQSMMFDLRKREFWLEQIPGVSGQCYGPFKLPAAFRKEDVAALDQLDHSHSRTPARRSDSYESRPARRNAFGSESGGLRNFARRSSGGEAGTRTRRSGGGEAGPAHSVYWRGRGGE